jgi:hypothetical protein
MGEHMDELLEAPNRLYIEKPMDDIHSWNPAAADFIYCWKGRIL